MLFKFLAYNKQVMSESIEPIEIPSSVTDATGVTPPVVTKPPTGANCVRPTGSNGGVRNISSMSNTQLTAASTQLMSTSAQLSNISTQMSGLGPQLVASADQLVSVNEQLQTSATQFNDGVSSLSQSSESLSRTAEQLAKTTKDSLDLTQHLLSAETTITNAADRITDRIAQNIEGLHMIVQQGTINNDVISKHVSVLEQSAGVIVSSADKLKFVSESADSLSSASVKITNSSGQITSVTSTLVNTNNYLSTSANQIGTSIAKLESVIAQIAVPAVQPIEVVIPGLDSFNRSIEELEKLKSGIGSQLSNKAALIDSMIASAGAKLDRSVETIIERLNEAVKKITTPVIDPEIIERFIQVGNQLLIAPVAPAAPVEVALVESVVEEVQQTIVAAEPAVLSRKPSIDVPETTLQSPLAETAPSPSSIKFSEISPKNSFIATEKAQPLDIGHDAYTHVSEDSMNVIITTVVKIPKTQAKLVKVKTDSSVMTLFMAKTFADKDPKIDSGVVSFVSGKCIYKFSEQYSIENCDFFISGATDIVSLIRKIPAAIVGKVIYLDASRDKASKNSPFETLAQTAGFKYVASAGTKVASKLLELMKQ